MPTLTIATTVTIPNGPPVPPISRTIEVGTACPTNVTVPSESWARFRLEGGLKELLKLFILNPSVQPDKKVGTTDKTAPVAATAPGATPAPADDQFAGSWFKTDDGKGEGHNSGEIPLTGAQVYMDKALDALFGPNQEELQQITFCNKTEKCLDVTIILGRDLIRKEAAGSCHSEPVDGAAAGSARKAP